jgi:hypothetical protein
LTRRLLLRRIAGHGQQRALAIQFPSASAGLPGTTSQMMLAKRYVFSDYGSSMLLLQLSSQRICTKMRKNKKCSATDAENEY